MEIIIVRMLTEQKHRFLVLRKVKVTLRESVIAEIKAVISRWGLSKLFKINQSDLRIKCVNGNEILFAGLDDVEKLKSIHGITSVWIEESSEINPEDFRQLDIRLRGKTQNYKQMIITFNPIDVNHWLKKEFFDKKKPDCTTLHSTYKDNRFLDAEAIKVLEGFKETDPYFYEVYALGQWGILGKTILTIMVSWRYLRSRNRIKTMILGPTLRKDCQKATIPQPMSSKTIPERMQLSFMVIWIWISMPGNWTL